jgi:hypothetical protein
MPKNVIMISKQGHKEVWGCLTAICNKYKEFQYHTIKKIDFPFEHKGWLFEKLEYKKATNNINK